MPARRNGAEKVRTRLLNQVDEKRSPRSRATMGQLVDRWFDLHDGEPSTLRGYETKTRNHIQTILGSLSLTRASTEVLDSSYADLVMPGATETVEVQHDESNLTVL